MPDYRRLYIPGGTYFFTLVTAQRIPIFSNPANADILRQSIFEVKGKYPFKIIAGVIMPDHLHFICTLPKGDTSYSKRIAYIKSRFTQKYLNAGGLEQPITENQKSQGRRGVWQPRFIEHTCRNQEDLAKHIDYIHYNPVKHGYVKRPVDWEYSSVHRYIKQGSIAYDWYSPGTYFDEPSLDIDSNLIE